MPKELDEKPFSVKILSAPKSNLPRVLFLMLGFPWPTTIAASCPCLKPPFAVLNFHVKFVVFSAATQ